MDAVLHVLRYLRGTYNQAILYHPVDKFADTLWDWVHSDWAADVDSRRSYTGHPIMINSGAVSWKSRRRDFVLLSTSEAEYVAASQCGQEGYNMWELLRDFGFAQTTKTTSRVLLCPKILSGYLSFCRDRGSLLTMAVYGGASNLLSILVCKGRAMKKV